MHRIAVCRHVSGFAFEQRILSPQSALHVEAVHEPDQNADAPYAAKKSFLKQKCQQKKA